ncbi:MAG: Lrp/AsnC family transcriptional regulator [Oscillospiraceae bacterium]|nr:Lrp/AsnC family transcriptional regulator [Oscillospiraceae bacterium]
MLELLRLLEKDCTLTRGQMAAMLGRSEAEVSDAIADFEARGVILRYKAVVDWEKTDVEMVTALIDVKVTPQRGEGFDRVAERIYQYDEVESLYLMSGGYDLSVLITGRTMKEVALFVAEKLAPLESVTGTATHFLLKKYKDGGVVFAPVTPQEERILMV